jgi:hypothetical protein
MVLLLGVTDQPPEFVIALAPVVVRLKRLELTDCRSALRASVVPPLVTPSMTTTVFSEVSTQSSARDPTTEANPVVVALRKISVFAMLIPELSHIYMF